MCINIHMCVYTHMYAYVYTHTFLMRLKVWPEFNHYGCVLEEMKKIKPTQRIYGHRRLKGSDRPF